MVQNTTLEDLLPKRQKHDKKELTDWFPKESIFDKKKTYMPSKVTVKEHPVNYRRICVGGIHVLLFKGEALTKSEFASFNDDEKKSWLNQNKKSKASKATD